MKIFKGIKFNSKDFNAGYWIGAGVGIAAVYISKYTVDKIEKIIEKRKENKNER